MFVSLFLLLLLLVLVVLVVVCVFVLFFGFQETFKTQPKHYKSAKYTHVNQYHAYIRL